MVRKWPNVEGSKPAGSISRSRAALLGGGTSCRAWLNSKGTGRVGGGAGRAGQSQREGGRGQPHPEEAEINSGLNRTTPQRPSQETTVGLAGLSSAFWVAAILGLPAVTLTLRSWH